MSKPYKTYLGEDTIDKYLNDMNIVLKSLTQKFNNTLVITEKYHEDFKNSIYCWICKMVYEEVEMKMKDHNHVIGKYQGSAHQGCNLNLSVSKKIPVAFDYLKNYDSHLIL